MFLSQNIPKVVPIKYPNILDALKKRKKKKKRKGNPSSIYFLESDTGDPEFLTLVEILTTSSRGFKHYKKSTSLFFALRSLPAPTTIIENFQKLLNSKKESRKITENLKAQAASIRYVCLQDIHKIYRKH